MRLVKIKYGIGYGTHETDMEVPEWLTEDEIDEDAWSMIAERLEVSWTLADDDA